MVEEGELEHHLENSFTLEGYNDGSKPCLTERCGGLVMPTYNANIGRCDTCETEYAWADYY